MRTSTRSLWPSRYPDQRGSGTVHVIQGRDAAMGLSWLEARFVGENGQEVALPGYSQRDKKPDQITGAPIKVADPPPTPVEEAARRKTIEKLGGKIIGRASSGPPLPINFQASGISDDDLAQLAGMTDCVTEITLNA